LEFQNVVMVVLVLQECHLTQDLTRMHQNIRSQLFSGVIDIQDRYKSDGSDQCHGYGSGCELDLVILYIRQT
jgi:hypothetical protein